MHYMRQLGNVLQCTVAAAAAARALHTTCAAAGPGGADTGCIVAPAEQVYALGPEPKRHFWSWGW
jgi:hypothetical protein